MNKKPKAVIISDIHYNRNTLQVADKATRMAINKANELDVPLIIAGDMHDEKANLRAECVNAIIVTIKLCNKTPYILVGNHSRINEKSHEHALNFLEPYAYIINTPRHDVIMGLHFIPYHSDLAALRRYLDIVPKGSTIIMHQGLKGSMSGEYIMDRTAINRQDICHFNVISGHYHNRQTTTVGKAKQFSYIGNPFTLGFGESGDAEKGFQILYDDSSLEFVPTNLRKHIIINWTFGTKPPKVKVGPEDLVWVKVQGTKQQLYGLSKDVIATTLGLTGAFKLDTIPTDKKVTQLAVTNTKSPGDTFDSMIDALDAEGEKKEHLKGLWKAVIDD